jgi:hypothetical protein
MRRHGGVVQTILLRLRQRRKNASRHTNYGAPLVILILKSPGQVLANTKRLAKRRGVEPAENAPASVPVGTGQNEILHIYGVCDLHVALLEADYYNC